MNMHSTNLDYGTGKDGAPNALFDGLARVVASFPTDRTHDTRRGSPSTPETILANAKLFAAAPELLAALERLTKALDDHDGKIPADIGSPFHQALAAIKKATS
jgi:hypothetical protein